MADWEHILGGTAMVVASVIVYKILDKPAMPSTVNIYVTPQAQVQQVQPTCKKAEVSTKSKVSNHRVDNSSIDNALLEQNKALTQQNGLLIQQNGLLATQQQDHPNIVYIPVAEYDMNPRLYGRNIGRMFMGNSWAYGVPWSPGIGSYLYMNDNSVFVSISMGGQRFVGPYNQRFSERGNLRLDRHLVAPRDSRDLEKGLGSPVYPNGIANPATIDRGYGRGSRK